MALGDEYRIKAAEIHARAKQDSNLVVRTELEKLAMAYLRLADQADNNSKTDLVYETPPERPGVQQQQQQPQQQPQSPPKKS